MARSGFDSLQEHLTGAIMGVSYYSQAVIGCKISEEKLYQKPLLEKRFNHNYGQDIKFCPKTGRELWREVLNPISQYNEDDRLGEYKLCRSNDTDLVVSLVGTKCVNACYDPGITMHKIDFVDLENKKQKLKSFLESLGLWNEDNFGLFNVVEVG